MSITDSANPSTDEPSQDYKEAKTPPPTPVATGEALPLPSLPHAAEAPPVIEPPRATKPPPSGTQITFPPPQPIADPQHEKARVCSEPLLRGLGTAHLSGKLYPYLAKKDIFLIRKLGAGGMGAVFLGKTLKLQKEVAVKVLDCGGSADCTFADRFKLEAELAAQLHSRHLVDVYDVDEEAGLNFIVMEYVFGQTAAEWLSQERSARRTITEQDALAVCIAATRGLASLHFKQIIHRDIKPGNIFIPFSDDGTALLLTDSKLGDLGLARKDDADEQLTVGARVTMGTPGYIPPEQIKSSKLAAKQSDVFSIGATLYTLLAGKQPWTGESSYEVLEATVNKPFEPIEKLRPSVAPELAALIQKCLEKEPEKRYKDGTELLRALESVAAGGNHLVSASMATRIPTEKVKTIAPPPPPIEPRVESVVPPVQKPDPKPNASAVPPTEAADPNGDQKIPPLVLTGPPKPVADPEAASCKMLADDNVQFTVYRPKFVRCEAWTLMLAFAHLSEKAADNPNAPDPIAEMKKQAAAVLGGNAANYANTSQPSSQPVPRNGLVTFVPKIEGAVFNPPQRSFFWLESVHREEFLVKADVNHAGRTLQGVMKIYCGPLILGEVPLSIRVDPAGMVRPPAPPRLDDMEKAPPARIYRKIFASYSHLDTPVVDACTGFAKVLGDEYFSNSVKLRSGEVWSARVRELIDDADVFQLFWSENSAKSDFVKDEVGYALSLSRQSFVRPVYWDDPMPARNAIPPGLAPLHFERLPLTLASSKVIQAIAPVVQIAPAIAVAPAMKKSPTVTPVVPPLINAPPAQKPFAANTPNSAPNYQRTPVVYPSSPPPAQKNSSGGAILAGLFVLAMLAVAGFFGVRYAIGFVNELIHPGDGTHATTTTTQTATTAIAAPTHTTFAPSTKPPNVLPPGVPVKFEFKVLCGISPGSCVLRSAALEKELRAKGLALAFFGAKLDDRARAKKLEAGDEDFGVFSLEALKDLTERELIAPPKIVLILSESTAANALVAHDNGPRFLEQLGGGNAFVFAQYSADDCLARTAVSKFPYVHLPPLLEPAESLDDVLNRYRTVRAEWPTRVYAMPELSALEAERANGRILIESGDLEVLVARPDLATARASELAEFFKIYFKALHAYSTPASGIENLLIENSKASAADAKRVAAHTRWLNASENLARYSDTQAGAALPESLKDAGAPRRLSAPDLRASSSEKVRDERLAPLTPRQWRDTHWVAELSDIVKFGAGVNDVGSDEIKQIQGISKILRLFSGCYVIIQGHAIKGDQETAQKRADNVRAVLLDSCGVDPNRLFAEVAEDGGPPVKGVTFKLVKPRE